MLSLLFLIPLLPLAGAVINGLFGRRLGGERAVALVACGAVLAAFVLSLGAVVQLATGLEGYAHGAPPNARVDLEARRVEMTLASWIPAGGEGSFVVDWAFTLDPLSAVMILVVTGVGFLIHVYATAYMHGDPGYARFFTYLNLFSAMMLTLVLGASFPVLFVGWEGVGLCSYLLIGFWYEDLANARAGMKAFLVNRIGDFGFVIGMLLIFARYGTLNFQRLAEAIEGDLAGAAGLTAIGLLLFVGATGKSAQLPLYVWLPDAMAGPTPVSALIHAATMVTAGIYMVARTSPLFAAAPLALFTVAVVGAATALFAATIGVAQNDIKKVLAYSTVSQLGYMFLGCGVGAFAAGIFHLTTHAFFKALLFLGSGSVIHAMSGEQDMRKMGGLGAKLPVTYRTFLLGTISIAGFIPFAGFFSKDEILWKAFEHGHPALWAAGSAAALLTAFYMFRLVYLTFSGACRADHETQHHIHESPRAMTIPLIVLAVLSVVGGWIGINKAVAFGADVNFFEHWLEPVFAPAARIAAWNAEHAAVAGHPGPHLGLGVEWLFIGIALAIATGGWAIARHLYVARPELPARIAARLGAAYRLVLQKYYIDEIYRFLFVDSLLGLSRGLAWIDARVVDGVVNGAAAATLGSARASSEADRLGVDGAVNAVGHLVYGGSSVYRRLQTGRIQNYAMGMMLGAFALISLYLILG
jgi:NADH-quinone oxidoreductase subunit L